MEGTLGGMKRVLFVVTEDWYFVSHRLHLVRAAMEAGYQVSVLTRVASHGAQIEEAGARLVPWTIERRSTNPFNELRTFWQVVSTIHRLRPEVVHAVALKPVLYAGLAAFVARRYGKVYAMAGLGNLFAPAPPGRHRLLRRAVLLLFSRIFRQPRSRVILQNDDDARLLVASGALAGENLRIVRGAGVDTAAFTPVPEPTVGAPLVVLPARMLWDKGVGEFVRASQSLRARGFDARFSLVGDRDPHNPACVPMAQLQSWHANGTVEYWGRRDDMPAVLTQAAIVCLPSYREGLPKALLEAASCGRPIVTYDVPGCREAVEHERNGLLVAAGDQVGLETALTRLLSDRALREQMGAAGRAKVLREFAQERIAAETLRVWREVEA